MSESASLATIVTALFLLHAIILRWAWRREKPE